MSRRFLCVLLAMAAALTLSVPALADGEAGPAGWTEREDGVYYLDDDGQPVTGWQQIDGQDYYFRADGRRASGWTAIGSQRYYFGGDGLAYTGACFVASSREVYLFSDEGVLQRSGTVELYGSEYSVGINGVVEGFLTSPVTRQAAAVLDQVGWDLRGAFDWAAGLSYGDRSLRAPEGTDHEDWYAQYGFANHSGNCYVMAAVFCQMARLLGCEVTYIEGGVGSASGRVIDHSWAEIVMDGQTYVFDPDFTHEEGRDGFQVWYGKQGTWYYYKFGPDGTVLMEG